MLKNIKASLIIKTIFDYLQRKLRFHIIKYNNELKKAINIELKDYKEYKSLKEFKKKYFLNQEDDANSLTLDLKFHGIENKGLKYFNIIEFHYLKELNLSKNNIIIK